MRFPRSMFAALAIMLTLQIACGSDEVAQALPLAGKTALVTGSTDGLGRELALALAAQGAHVVVHGRSVERGQAVVDEITAAGTGTARFIAADFGSMQAVRDFADAVAASEQAVEMLSRRRERDRIRCDKEPDRRYIHKIRRDSATQSQRIRAARSPAEYFNSLLDNMYPPGTRSPSSAAAYPCPAAHERKQPYVSHAKARRTRRGIRARVYEL